MLYYLNITEWFGWVESQNFEGVPSILLLDQYWLELVPRLMEDHKGM